MEKENLFVMEGNAMPSSYNSFSFGMDIQSTELNCKTEQLPNCLFNPNWENSVDQSDPFESALSSIVSSPVASNAGVPCSGGENAVLRELIGRLGSICNSGDASPHSYIAGNSTNTSCYSTPLNSPPKLNLSMMEHQIRGNLPIPGNHLPPHPCLTPFSTDPGFAERAAKFSCFGSRNFGGPNPQFVRSESELSYRLAPRVESGKLSRVSSNQSIKLAGPPPGALEIKDGLLLEGIQASERKFSRFSRSSSPENGELGESQEASSVCEQITGGETAPKDQTEANTRKRKSILRGKAREIPSPLPAKNVQVAADSDEPNAKRKKPDEATGNEKDGPKEQSDSGKATGDGNQKHSKDSAKPPEPPKDYIHVRARRGQATDSHSLAERVRREKISERMKFLQDLVPGCNKVTGKAVMLDEIINYVQSLQRQVEFLSMKLATVNPRMDFNMEAFLSKDICQSRGAMPHNIYQLDASTQAFPYGFQSQQGQSLLSGISNGTENPFLVNLPTAAVRRNHSMQLPLIDGFGEAASQVPTFWEDDLQSLVQMGFGQNQPQSFPGTMVTTQTKIEL